MRALCPPTLRFLSFLPFVAVLASGCGDRPTWIADIQPLFEGRCLTCHGPGDVSGLDLSRYEAAQAFAEPISAAVESGSMPPWPAQGSCSDYRFDPTLTDEERALVLDWVDAGAPEGPPTAIVDDPPPQVQRPLTRVDLELPMPVAYTPRGTPDDYRCFLLDWPLEAEAFVTGFRARPGNRSVVHHVITFVIEPADRAEYDALDAADAEPGWECFGGPGGSSYEAAKWLGGWAPGNETGDQPADTGILVEPGSALVVQVHYNVTAPDPAPDTTILEIMLADDVERPASIQPWTDPGWLGGSEMVIPAHSEGVSHAFSYPYWAEAEVHSVMLYMHRLGRSASLTVRHTNGAESCLLAIPRWDYDWQMTYTLSEPARLRAGDVVTVECTWDNPTDTDVDWGDGTGDEMCLATLYLAPPG